MILMNDMRVHARSLLIFCCEICDIGDRERVYLHITYYVRTFKYPVIRELASKLSAVRCAQAREELYRLVWVIERCVNILCIAELDIHFC